MGRQLKSRKDAHRVAGRASDHERRDQVHEQLPAAVDEFAPAAPHGDGPTSKQRTATKRRDRLMPVTITYRRLDDDSSNGW